MPGMPTPSVIASSGSAPFDCDAAGKPRTEILQLVAMNQLDLIEPMMKSDQDRAFLKDILEQRKNLRDRFNFEADLPTS